MQTSRNKSNEVDNIFLEEVNRIYSLILDDTSPPMNHGLSDKVDRAEVEFFIKNILKFQERALITVNSTH